MRLGQIARKLDVKTAEIRTFIKKEFEVELPDDPNLKLEEDHESALMEEFGKVENVLAETDEEPEKVWADQSVATSAEPEDTDSAKAEISEADKEEVLGEEMSEAIEVSNTTEDKPVGEETDESDKEEGETKVDPDTELIKAPKVTLEGPKVVGKIELPEKKKEEPEAIEGSDEKETPDDEITAELEATMDAVNQDIKGTAGIEAAEEVKENVEEEEEDSIYKDKRGIYHFTQQQRENRKRSLELIADKKRKEAKKRKKKRHYEKIVKEQLPTQERKKKKKPQKKQRVEKPEPKGLWQKFLNWLND